MLRIASLGLALLLVACRGDEARMAEASDGTLLSPYLAIGEVLASDRVDNLPELAGKLIEASEGHAADPGVEVMLVAAGRIASPDIATARLMYGKLSEGMIAWLAANPEQREGLMLIHCPMTFNNQGSYWVQRAGKVRNPYEGSMMLHCGAKLDWADHRQGQPPSGEVVVEGMPAP